MIDKSRVGATTHRTVVALPPTWSRLPTWSSFAMRHPGWMEVLVVIACTVTLAIVAPDVTPRRPMRPTGERWLAPRPMVVQSTVPAPPKSQPAAPTP